MQLEPVGVWRRGVVAWWRGGGVVKGEAMQLGRWVVSVSVGRDKALHRIKVAEWSKRKKGWVESVDGWNG
ncbi:hypothetical protein E2C01_070785 [Portunus trituberculatus]|uniref:Uncharacterized protein n=1 Tax=Portunus trituberculatus TaxID=210409 RepID=A0A5B7I2J9_PORTR|nr:hypothetical protein [Portunus trituberculatus]